jgi:hypothetical protein
VKNEILNRGESRRKRGKGKETEQGRQVEREEVEERKTSRKRTLCVGKGER